MLYNPALLINDMILFGDTLLNMSVILKLFSNKINLKKSYSGGRLFSDQGFCSMKLVVNSRVPFTLPQIVYVLTYVLISISV